MSEPYYAAPQKKTLSPGAWVAIGCGIAICAAGAFAVVILVAVFGALRSSTPFKEATSRAQRDHRVIAALGQPIKVDLWLAGSVSTKNSDGEADLNIGLTGPKRKARLFVVGTKKAGVWSYSIMRVE